MNSESTFPHDTPWAKNFAPTKSLSKQKDIPSFHNTSKAMTISRHSSCERSDKRSWKQRWPPSFVLCLFPWYRDHATLTCWLQTALLLCITITTQFRLEDRTIVMKVNWIFHDNRSTILYMITKHKTLPTTTLYYKACTKYFPVLLFTTKLAQTTSQYYFVLQSLHKAPPSTTVHYKACTNYFPVLFVLQSLHKALPSTTVYYRACTKHFPVRLCTTKLAQTTSQYYFVLQSLHKALPSTTVYYKACTNKLLPSTTVTKQP